MALEQVSGQGNDGHVFEDFACHLSVCGTVVRGSNPPTKGEIFGMTPLLQLTPIRPWGNLRSWDAFSSM